MAHGATLGEMLVATVNDPNQRVMASRCCRPQDLLGDPTLRLAVVPPPKCLKAVKDAQGNVALSWAPGQSSPAWYSVYRDTSLDGTFSTRLNTTLLTQPTFLDTPAPSGTKLYQVRALRLEWTGSGAYTNSSQGIFITVN